MTGAKAGDSGAGGPERQPPGRPRRRRRLSGGSLGAFAVTGALVAAGLFVSLGAEPFVVQETPVGALGFEALGHRGARGLMPENTLPGFGRTLTVGVTTLELDVVLTADGVPVVLHDRRLPADRTRDPQGRWLEGEGPAVVDLNLAALQAYDVGCARPGGRTAERFPAQPCLERVPPPTLAAVLALGEARSGGRIRYSIETKLAPDDPAGSAAPAALAEAVIAAVREAGVASRVAVQSFDWRSLAAVQALAPGLPTVHLTAEQSWLDNLERGRPGASPWLGGLDADDYPGGPPALVEAAGGSVWSPYYRDLRPELIEAAHGLGLRVVAWTVNDPVTMARLIDDGVDGIVTDYPDRLRIVLSNKRMALPAPYLPRIEGGTD
ncbi:MAG: glycerophosphodiester phosphodiesterase [Tistlia sp.]|uniref:glycerophosphodiester phosphodiesterase n=1 Tax=Tistlia sp. TaxID=3057121 RepID=UPI0034A0E384